MAAPVSRKQFLRGDFFGKKNPVRPPWSIEESHFTDTCSRCHECIQHCPEGIIVKGAGGFPEVDFSLGECSFCGECVNHCKPKALYRLSDDDPAWQVKAFIGNTCIAHQGVFCVSCKEQCEAEAIIMHHGDLSIPYPIIDTDRCTGCGACYQPCPIAAIELHPIDEQEEENAA